MSEHDGLVFAVALACWWAKAEGCGRGSAPELRMPRREGVDEAGIWWKGEVLRGERSVEEGMRLARLARRDPLM